MLIHVDTSVLVDAFTGPRRSLAALESATIAAALYRQVKRARSHSRQADLAIAACAIEQGASLWTLNASDFNDIPGLRLYQPSLVSGSES